MRLSFGFAALAIMLVSTPAIAADQTVQAGNGDALWGLHDKPYWELFALCARSMQTEARTDPGRAELYGNIAKSSETRGLARLELDRGLKEDAARKAFGAKTAATAPVADVATTCSMLVRKHDHDLKYAPPKPAKKLRKYRKRHA